MSAMQMQRQQQKAQTTTSKEQTREQDLKQQQEAERLEKLKEYEAEIKEQLNHVLTHMGYMPPTPSPFLMTRTFRAIAQEVQNYAKENCELAEALSLMEHELEAEHGVAQGFFEQIRQNVSKSTSLTARVKTLLQHVDPIIGKAVLSIDVPNTSEKLKTKMLEIEKFLAENWVAEKGRGVLAIHVDEESQTTILQIGIAEYGPIYLTVPKVLRPNDVALNSLRELLQRTEPFSDTVDPLAVINGSYQGINFSEIFRQSRVMRAPSGDTSRLRANITETSQRARLSAGNTVIINSAPATREEYLRVFPNDRAARHWAAWGGESQEWNAVATSANFGTSSEASRAAVLAALSHAENVVVIVAHCDGQTLFMPDPPPGGTTISAGYLRDHREEITANKPFVYLFSCEAGNLANLENFASTLLECGASGVIASQTTLQAGEGRDLFQRLLAENRGQPPIEDFWSVSRDSGFFEMEVFLA